MVGVAFAAACGGSDTSGSDAASGGPRATCEDSGYWRWVYDYSCNLGGTPTAGHETGGTVTGGGGTSGSAGGGL